MPCKGGAATVEGELPSRSHCGSFRAAFTPTSLPARRSKKAARTLREFPSVARERGRWDKRLSCDGNRGELLRIDLEGDALEMDMAKGVDLQLTSPSGGTR